MSLHGKGWIRFSVGVWLARGARGSLVDALLFSVCGNEVIGVGSFVG